MNDTDKPAAEPCTNWYRTRRHLSTNLAVDDYYRPGRTGRSLCWSESNPVTVYDQTAVDVYDRERRQLGFAKKPVVVADLPACKKCAAKLAKMKSE